MSSTVVNQCFLGACGERECVEGVSSHEPQQHGCDDGEVRRRRGREREGVGGEAGRGRRHRTVVGAGGGSAASDAPDEGDPGDGLGELQADGPLVGRRGAALRRREWRSESVVNEDGGGGQRGRRAGRGMTK